jgi:hypothetical protein
MAAAAKLSLKTLAAFATRGGSAEEPEEWRGLLKTAMKMQLAKTACLKIVHFGNLRKLKLKA